MPIEREQAARVLEALVSLIRVARTIAHRDSAHSVTATPIALLKLVSQTDPRLGDLAEQLRVKPSVASRAVAALEDEGYVSRISDPEDARACRVSITDTGRAYLETREDWALDMLARTFSDWSPDDADRSVRVLQRLEQSIDEWMSEFERAAAHGADPLAGAPDGGTATQPRRTETASTAGHNTQNQSADGVVRTDHPNPPLIDSELTTSAITNWETTAV